MNHDDDWEARLRSGMRDEAESVGPVGGFANRVVEFSRSEVQMSGGRRWLFPLAAAAAAALLIAGVPLGIHLVRSSNDEANAPDTSPTVSQSVPVTSSSAPAPTTSQPTTSHATTASTSPSPTQSKSDGGQVPAGFRVADLTWIGNDSGFALGGTNLLSTADGGRHWTSVSSALPSGVTHLRFANANVGYLWGDHLYLTSDGGRTWERQADSDYSRVYGQPDTYELSNGVAMRLTYSGGQFHLEKAPIGTNDWTVVTLPANPEPGRLAGSGASYRQDLSRVGDRAVILMHRNPAGGAEHAYSELFVSDDNGGHWRDLGEPCPQLGYREVDSTGLSMGDDASISVLCRVRDNSGAPFVAISTDGGLTFRAAPESLGDGTRAIAEASATSLLALSDAVYHSADTGRTWQKVVNDPSIPSSGALPDVRFMAFESASVGRYVSQDGRSVFTTRDGGATWAEFDFV